MEERIHLLPRFPRRSHGHPLLGFAPEAWADDPAFDLRWHVRRVALPAPGGLAELDAFVGQEMGRRLDRDRPLWELTVVEHVAGGHAAVLTKIHHALADGVAAIAAGVLLLDPTPEPLEIPAPEEAWSPRRCPLRRHLRNVATAPMERAARLGLDRSPARASSPARAVRDDRRASELVTELARTRPQAPMTALNEPLGTARAFRSLPADLDALKAAGKAAGGTVNDAVLAAVTGMLRGYLAEAGGDVRGRRPVALVPMSVRARGRDRRAGQPDLDGLRRPPGRDRRRPRSGSPRSPR